MNVKPVEVIEPGTKDEDVTFGELEYGTVFSFGSIGGSYFLKVSPKSFDVEDREENEGISLDLSNFSLDTVRKGYSVIPFNSKLIIED